MISRRQFLQDGSLISLSPWIPVVFSRTSHAAGANQDQPVLVVIQMDGGNDGINTVVPFQDDGYGRARTALQLAANDLHKLDEHVGLHPEMKAAKQLYDDGLLSVIHGVGYPNPDRSHFNSMRIWHSAFRDEVRQFEDGWLGRALDLTIASDSGDAEANAIHTGDQETPQALWGRRSTAVSMKSPDQLVLDLDSVKSLKPTTTADDRSLNGFTARQFRSAMTAADDFSKIRKSDRSETKSGYPNSQLASQLKFISQLLQGNSPARVFYAVQTGYDTHSDQLNTHGQLLQDFAEALKAFLDDMRGAKINDRVTVLAFSEFGRRVAENDSKGTDHGTAGPVFLAGTPVRAGQVGKAPSLTDIDDGDLKSQFDFRQIYASILDTWLKVPSAKILGDRFEGLKLFNT